MVNRAWTPTRLDPPLPAGFFCLENCSDPMDEHTRLKKAAAGLPQSKCQELSRFSIASPGTVLQRYHA